MAKIVLKNNKSSHNEYCDLHIMETLEKKRGMIRSLIILELRHSVDILMSHSVHIFCSFF